MKKLVQDLISRILDCRSDATAKRATYLCAEAAGEMGGCDVCVRIESADDLEILAGAKPAVSKPADDLPTPFILDGELLYTRRNWKYERAIAARLKALCQEKESLGTEEKTSIASAIRNTNLNEAQRNAAFLMSTSRFSILTGGPGTGKTHTLAEAVKIALSLDSDMKIVLAAPTGKAAARMTEAFSKLEAGNTISAAQTLHKLIGATPVKPNPARTKENPIDAGWLIVDEASMIDLATMAKLLEALPGHARITLVGDANQLASVERGRVFGDLCAAEWAQDKIVRLVESRRFENGGEIDIFAKAVNRGESKIVLELLGKNNDKIDYNILDGKSFASPSNWKNFNRLVTESFGDLASSKSPEEALAHINDFRILTVDRIGPFGCNKINDYILKLLARSLDRPISPIPVMVARNDIAIHISNGDIGVIMPSEPGFVYLPQSDDGIAESGEIRKFPFDLLENAELAYASTIHKSQGSEFNDVAIILGTNKDSPLLTREILYTGITRTRDRIHLYANKETIAQCCECATVRISGLR